jgi:hypothetical protein
MVLLRSSDKTLAVETIRFSEGGRKFFLALTGHASESFAEKRLLTAPPAPLGRRKVSRAIDW